MIRLKTLALLGLGNVGRVVLYRLLIKLGIHPAQRLKAVLPNDKIFFRLPILRNLAAEYGPLPWLSAPLLFGWRTLPTSEAPPLWRKNPIESGVEAPLVPWWLIPDFNLNTGDIKHVWELSRFEWAVCLALSANQGTENATDKLNFWLADWWKNNPPFLGPNWKCAQEASIRVLRLLLTANLLGQIKDAETALVETIAVHIKRILPTLSYAKGQQNNHETSEAAAIWVGGLFLKAHGHPLGKVAETGKLALESALAHLILSDGSFSQNSTNYHRFMLDSVCLAEIARKSLDGAVLGKPSMLRLQSAIAWLEQMSEPDNGQPINLGHNDSAYLLPYTQGQSRDFRITLGVSYALFSDKVPSHLYQIAKPLCDILGIRSAPRDIAGSSSQLFPDGGYATLIAGSTRATLRLPQYHFRPSHCDGLHVDLWIGARNIFRDSGTASYISPANGMPDLSLTRHHNTIQFDADEQMPRLSRFLWGDWLRPLAPPRLQVERGISQVSSEYSDRKQRKHSRTAMLQVGKLEVIDIISGLFDRATLRWHLVPGPWKQTGAGIFVCNGITVSVSGEALLSLRIVPTLEALHYGQTSAVPCLEVVLNGLGKITTNVSWDTP